MKTYRNHKIDPAATFLFGLSLLVFYPHHNRHRREHRWPRQLKVILLSLKTVAQPYQPSKVEITCKSSEDVPVHTFSFFSTNYEYQERLTTNHDLPAKSPTATQPLSAILSASDRRCYPFSRSETQHQMRRGRTHTFSTWS